MLYYSKCLQLNPYKHLFPKNRSETINSPVGIAGHAESTMEFSSMLRGCSKSYHSLKGSSRGYEKATFYLMYNCKANKKWSENGMGGS